MPEQVIAGRYRLRERLGTGAMAQIWLAHDLELERRVAVKILRPDADRERFRREARAVAGLSHPNVCRLYDFGELDEGPFMVLEYLPGGSLADRLASGEPLPDEESRRIAAEIAAGLAHAHERGLVHRDLKPANVLFDDEGRAKIADFGIVLMTDTAALTETGTILGTATYISPEQAAGEPATPASDVYSFGAVLFHMLTGRPPFESSSAIDVVRRHRTEPAPPVSTVRPEAPADLAAATDAALAKDPADRPADGAALSRAIVAGSGTTVAPPLPLEGEPTLVVPRARKAPRAVSRRVVAAAAAAALLVAAGIGLAVIATRDDSGTSPPAAPARPPPDVPGHGTTVATDTLESTGETTTTNATTTEPTTAPATEPATPTTPATTTRPTTSAPATVPATLPTTTEPAPPTTTEPATTAPTTDTSATTTAGTLTQ